MEPLNQFEIHELMEAMSEHAAPVGSVWSPPNATNLFVVLLHVNLATSIGTEQGLVLQTIPSGECWVSSLESMIQNGWSHMSYIWNRNNER